MTENSNNVIKFPKAKITNVLDVETLNKEQADEHIALLKNYIITRVVGTIMEEMDKQLAVAGYPIDDDTAKDGGLVAEALRSLLLKKYQEEHPFQTLAEEMFEINNKDELILTGNLRIVNSPSTNNNYSVAVGNT